MLQPRTHVLCFLRLSREGTVLPRDRNRFEFPSCGGTANQLAPGSLVGGSTNEMQLACLFGSHPFTSS